MINLKWYAGIGYGDILLPISYAHNLSYTFGEEVNLRLLHSQSIDYKYNKDCKEFLWAQADYLNSICDKSNITGVNITHKFHDTSRVRWSGYHESLLTTARFHNQWYSNKPLMSKSNKIVIGSTVNNKVPLHLYAQGRKTWKSSQNWNALSKDLSRFSETHEIVNIDYTTPISDAIEHLNEASLFIGYHGGMAWLARFCGTPSTILVKNNSLSKSMFSNAILRKSIAISSEDYISFLIESSSKTSLEYRDNFYNRNYTKSKFTKALSCIKYVN